MIYCLSKMSSPRWATTRFWFISSLRKELEINICKLCYIDIAEDYDNMKETAKVSELLNTPCGAEFMINNLAEKRIKHELY